MGDGTIPKQLATPPSDEQPTFSLQFVHRVKQLHGGPLVDKAEEYAERLLANGIDDWSVARAVSFEDLRLLDIPVGHARAILELIKADSPEVVQGNATAGVDSATTGAGPMVGTASAGGEPSLDVWENLPFESGLVENDPLPQQEGAFEQDDEGSWSTDEI